MRYVKYEYGKSAARGGAVVALGLFDGVHLAHRDLISRAVSLARERGLCSAVFTFESESERLKGGNGRLYSTKQRLDLIKTLGVDVAIVADFDSISDLSPEDFVRNALVRDCGAKLAVAGFNFRFGRGASAGASELVELMKKNGADAELCREITFRESTLSTSLIKSFLRDRRPDLAAEALGVPFYLEGEVLHGLGLGKKLGAPTVNLPLRADFFSPPSGVYRSAVLLRGRLYPAVTNVGSCPTVGERTEHAETHIIGFDEPIYGEKIKVFLLDYLREERRFESQKELIMQINVDKNAALPQKGDTIWTDSGLSLP